MSKSGGCGGEVEGDLKTSGTGVRGAWIMSGGGHCTGQTRGYTG